jgi:hypothetical protein
MSCSVKGEMKISPKNGRKPDAAPSNEPAAAPKQLSTPHFSDTINTAPPTSLVGCQAVLIVLGK